MAPSSESSGRSVAFLVTGSGLGGAEFEVRHLALSLKQRGWAVGVISMQAIGAPFNDLEEQGIRTAGLGMRKGVPDLRGLLQLRAVLSDWRPALLHGHMFHANILARVSRLVSPPQIVLSTIHSQSEGGYWRYAAYRLTNRLSKVTTAVSRVAAAEATKKGAAPPGTIVYVPNGLITSEYKNDPLARTACREEMGLGNCFFWLAVGRLARPKNYPNLLSAFSIVRRAQPESRLAIAGQGPLDAALREQIVALDLSDAVRMLGIRRDVPQLMQAADGFVLSSDWEGLPMVLLEAGASGLPIVSTRVSGTADALDPDRSGLLCDPGDPRALASAMLRLMALSEAQRRAMGEAGRTHVVKNFEMEVVVARWEHLYDLALEGTASRMTPGRH